MTSTEALLNRQDRNRFEADLFDHICFMLVAARGCVEEPHLYGPLRLLDSVSRLVELLDGYGLGSDFLRDLRAHIDANKFKVMTDQEDFVRLIDEAVMLCVRKEVDGTA